MKKEFEYILRTEIDNVFSERDGFYSRCADEDWERLLETNPVIKAALKSLQQAYDLALKEIGLVQKPDYEPIILKALDMATIHCNYAENFDSKTNAYLDGIRYGAYTALELNDNPTSIKSLQP